MYIVIIGSGEVGSYLARLFVEEEHDVAIIEQDEKLARELENSIDALVVHGSGVDIRSLQQAGIKKADLVLAVTQVDEVNMVACMTAAKVGNSPRTVARVREAGYHLGGDKSLTAREMGIGLLVGPERAVAEEVVGLLSYEGAGQIWSLAGDRLRLLELPLSSDSPLVHETLAELAEVFPEPSLVVAVAGAECLRIPRGDDQLAAHDRAYILTGPENIEEFMILSGKPWHHVRHVLIIGCGKVGFYLAQELEAQQLFPTIIECDEERAEVVARKLRKSIVLHGDGTDPNFLREQLEERADAVVILIDDNAKALVTGLIARDYGAKKVIVRCDDRAYAATAHKLGIDALLSPRRAVADAIVRFVRKGRVHAAHMLGDHDAEIIELKIPVRPNHPEILEKRLADLDFPEGALVGAVIRGDEVTVARGDTQLRSGDELLVVALPKAIPKVERLLE